MSGQSTVVIDDKFDDGIAITNTLWNAGVPCMFFEYSEDKLAEKIQKQIGVRLIFQDIQLLHGSAPTISDYDQAALSIEHLLEDNNGPWLMAVWSTWQDEHAENLFNHLQENLSENKRPFAYIGMEKARFCSQVEHSAVRALNKEDLVTLFAEAIAKVGDFPNYQAMLGWELSANKAIQSTFSELSAIPMGMNTAQFDDGLGKLLSKLGSAGSSENAPLDVKSSEASRILNTLMSNRAFLETRIELNDNEIPEEQEAIDEAEQAEWKRRINKILHIETNSLEISYPGSVYSFKMPRHYYSEDGQLIEGLQEHYGIDELIEEQLRLIEKKPIYPSVRDSAKLVLIDITPSCDHAQNKAKWRKFCVGLELNIPTEKTLKQVQNICGSLKSKWKSPLFSTKTQKGEIEYKALIVDPKLIMHIPDSDDFMDQLDSNLFCLKEQLFRDLVDHVSSHLGRPGIVNLY